ncbi:MAG: GerMN domain-containing protein [Firmicutes bacterium]|nr:GerMN domain-containing protein [Bacillota bacterium]
MNRSYREWIGWLFLASLLLAAIVWGGRLWNTVSWHLEPKTDIQLYIAAPGGGIEVESIQIAKSQFDAQGLWKEMQAVSVRKPQSLLPADAELLEARQEGSTLVVSFSRELAQGQYLGSNQEIALVYCIVNTMAQLPGIESVRILIEGHTVESLADHVDLTAPLEPDLTLIITQ